MPKSLRLLSFLTLLASVAATSPRLRAADPAVEGARAADDARVAAITSGDAAKMSAVFSDDFVYIHSTGKVNHKADFISSITSGGLKYVSLDYEARNFRVVAPGLVLVHGRCRVHAISGGKDENNYLSFLMAYRNENGVWRFLGWQSCKLTPASPPYVP